MATVEIKPKATVEVKPKLPKKKVDISELQQPLQIGTRGVQMIMKCMENGTPEIKNLLLSEIDIIFECKVCRSLFRGLPNLLSHKRSFCMKQYVEQRKEFPSATASDTCYVEPTEPDPQYAEPEEEVSAAEVRARKVGRIRDPILISLSKNYVDPKAPPMGPVPVPQFTDPLPCNLKIPSMSAEKREQIASSKVVVQVSPLKELLPSSSALQSALTSPVIGSMSSVVQNLASRFGSTSSMAITPLKCTPATSTLSITTVEPTSPDDDFMDSLDSSPKSPNGQREMLRSMKGVDIQKKKCLLCCKSFLHWQYLLSHMRSKHSEERKLYKCLYCDTVFQYTRSIGRHLVRRHKKLPRDIAGCLKQIREQSITVKADLGIGSPPVSPTQDEPLSDPDSSSKMFTGGFSLNNCRKCGKVFGKKVTRDCHEKVCQKKTKEVKGLQGAGDRRKRGRPKKTTPSLVTVVCKRKVGRPRKFTEEGQETDVYVKTEKDEIRQNGKDDCKQNGKEEVGMKRRGRLSIDRQSSTRSSIDSNYSASAKARPLTPSGANSKVTKTVPKTEKPDALKETTESPLKKTGYQETFEDIASPYMNASELRCLVCQQIFHMKATLVTHVCAIHLQMKRFRCTICDWKGLFKSEVVNHVRSRHHSKVGSKVKEKLLPYAVPI